jgi:hypothetical protein
VAILKPPHPHKEKNSRLSEKTLMYPMKHTGKRCKMETDAETKIKQDLLAEIQNLEHNYEIIANFTAGIEYDVSVIGTSIQSFKDSLSRASAFVLALYNLKGKRVNIPWDPLFTSLDYAIATLTTAPKKAAVQAILSMSEAQMQQVMSYFEALKESLK